MKQLTITTLESIVATNQLPPSSAACWTWPLVFVFEPSPAAMIMHSYWTQLVGTLLTLHTCTHTHTHTHACMQIAIDGRHKQATSQRGQNCNRYNTLIGPTLNTISEHMVHSVISGMVSSRYARSSNTDRTPNTTASECSYTSRHVAVAVSSRSIHVAIVVVHTLYFNHCNCISD
jgi:hypothetical protein